MLDNTIWCVSEIAKVRKLVYKFLATSLPKKSCWQIMCTTSRLLWWKWRHFKIRTPCRLNGTVAWSSLIFTRILFHRASQIYRKWIYCDHKVGVVHIVYAFRHVRKPGTRNLARQSLDQGCAFCCTLLLTKLELSAFFCSYPDSPFSICILLFHRGCNQY